MGKLLLLATLCVSLGLHWALLQSMAWVGMVVTYAQSDPIPEALRKTFDGKHPCKVCTLVAEGKKSEQEKTVKLPLQKIDFFLERAGPILFASEPRAASKFVPDSCDRPSQAPPTPPPRFV